MKNKKNSKKNIERNRKELIDLIVKIVLVLIIIILLVRNCTLVKENNAHQASTGKIDIIEIKCDATNMCEDPSNNGQINVYDGTIKWNGVAEAKIFTNPMYKIDGTIAPEDSNAYQFVIKNGINSKIKYSILLSENNPYNANIKYKLKKNDTYIVDHYVSAKEILAADIVLEDNGSDTFYLEWKWISSSNDTKIGSKMNATYTLKMEIKAESING